MNNIKNPNATHDSLNEGLCLKSERNLPFLLRFSRYLKERFPLHQHGLLIVTFVFSAAAFSRICRHTQGFIPITQFIVGAVTTVLLFLLLRIADEFKDHSEDCRFRPYRAVPRGLISLRELGFIAMGIIIVQITINALLMPRMLPPCLFAMGYLALMSKEFFCSVWLKRHPIIYMLTHMAIMPIIDIYTTGLDWINSRVAPSSLLFLFLIISYSNGIVIEMGRKIRAREAEEPGVETYSALFGESGATVFWLLIVIVTFIIAVAASGMSGTGILGIPLLSVCLVSSLTPAVMFLKQPVQSKAKKIETAAGIWTLGMYLILGAAPMVTTFLKKIMHL